MYGNDKHVCMLMFGPRLSLHPTATIWQKLISKFRKLTLPCEWHHGTALFIRSLKRLRLERRRHYQNSWFIWHPYSPIKYYWDCIQLIFLFTAYLYMPFQVFYNCPNNYDPFILFTDVLAFLNLGSRFCTGYIDKDSKVIILNPKKIAINYLKTNFLTNFIGALPLQLIDPFDNCQYPTHTAWFLFKLLRAFSLSDQWKNVVGQLQLSYITYVASKVITSSILFFHWMTYVHHQVPLLCYHIYDPKDQAFAEWLKEFCINTHPEDPEYSSWYKYTANLYLTCGACVGLGDYTPLDRHIVPEFLLGASMGLVGLIFVTYTFPVLLRLMIYRQFDSYLFIGKYRQLEENMSFMRLPKFLQKKIKLFLNYKFNGYYFNEEAIQNTINEQIKQDINLHCCRGLVMNVPMFQDMPVALINSILFNLVRVLYMPGEVIVKFGNSGHSLHLISSGTVAVMNEVGREVAHLRDGAFFGENALLHPGIQRTATIIALEITEIYMLYSKEFSNCLLPYPHLKRKMDEINHNKRSALLRHAATQRQRKRRH